MATKKRVKVVRVPGTTNNITKGIINYLASRGHFAFRVNNTGVWDEQKQLFRKTGSEGVADIIGCINSIHRMPGVNFLYGQFIAIEVKNKATRDRMSAAQKEFRDCTESALGIYFVAKGYEEFVQWFESIYGKI